ncbi:MAG TPA: phospholipase A [Telluria sp.]
MQNIPVRKTLATLLVLSAVSPLLHAAPASLADCMKVGDKNARLACFDQLAAASTAAAQPAAAAPPPAALTDADAEEIQDAQSSAASTSRLAAHWELGELDNRELRFRPHQANYLMATYSHAPNGEPYLPFRNLLKQEKGLSHAELAYQLSFKMKMVDQAFNKPLDLWFGYTQKSFWQAANHDASSPFRETNYEPEVMAVVPLKGSLLGVNARFAGIGFVHQSNGQAGSLSRSWNRTYAQLGVDSGNFSLVGRVWKRMSEALEDDNNPDIVDYMGRGDLMASYLWDNGQELTANLRYNLSTNKSGVQIGYTYPIAGKVGAYVQVFSGYGQSLIDYNYLQRSIGFGFKVSP